MCHLSAFICVHPRFHFEVAMTVPFERPTPSRIMRLLGFVPDAWQMEVLELGSKRLLLNCCRQAGKSTVAAVLALVEAFNQKGSLVLILSRSQRQAAELYHKVAGFYEQLGSRYKKRQTIHELELDFHSRIVSLPCQPDTVRGYSNVQMLIIDEAARVPDALYRAVRPMLATSGGRLVCLSTPNGRHGFFHDEWTNGGRGWHRIEVPASQVARIEPEFLEDERRALGEQWFRQEYCCSFEALEGLVFPDFARCIVHPAALSPVPVPVPEGHTASGGGFEAQIGQGQGHGHVKRPVPSLPVGRKVGGIDFGYRNPFAAIWGVLDRDSVLWLTGEHYERQKPLSYHSQHIPRDVRWYADPSGAAEIAELRCAGFSVSAGDNSLRLGIAAVASRIDNGTLKVLAGACPQLLGEASRYRYNEDPTDRRSETPLDAHNHALAALRYLVTKLDARQMARLAGKKPAAEPAAEDTPKPEKPDRKWLSVRNEALWRRIF
jgi:hypothetical protein